MKKAFTGDKIDRDDRDDSDDRDEWINVKCYKWINVTKY